MNTGLYIHVPFCVRKCPYCDFYSVSSSDDSVYRRYTDAALRNICRYLKKYPSLNFDTVYFGGGTPSLMPAYFYSEILSAVRNFTELGAEITMELNPGTADREKLSLIRECGVNRISVGIQSASDNELSDLGRIHDFSDVVRAVSDIRAAGFTNISGDLMAGIKGQTKESLRSSVKALADLSLNHISSYMLKIEPGTEFGKNGMADEIPDEDISADMYLLMVEELEKRGYFQYEISNFSKPGFESRHNLKYWNSEDYIGIGPSAHSCFEGRRYEVPRNLQQYIYDDFQQEIVNEESPGSFFEKAMLALRLVKGLDLKKYPDERPLVMKRAEKFSRTGLIKTEDDVIRFTPKGFLVSNSLIAEILADF